MDSAHSLALAIFVSYFLVILALFALILRSLPPIQSHHVRPPIYVFSFLTVASFAHTWFYMFKFMHWSLITHEKTLGFEPTASLFNRISEWLLNTALFEQAWLIVCAGPRNWWWSEQICLYTVGAWTIFLVVQGHVNRVRHTWAYMLLGQLVAISVASNLFFLALLLARVPPLPKSKETKPAQQDNIFPLTLAAIPGTAFLWIRKTPESVGTPYFLKNLLSFHVAIFLVMFLSRPSALSTFSIQPWTVYVLLAPLAYLMRLETMKSLVFAGGTRGPLSSAVKEFLADPLPLDVIVRAMEGLKSHGWQVLHSHPAQSSIGWDVVWTTASVLAWAVLQATGGHQKRKTWINVATLLMSLALTPFVGVGVMALLVFAVY